MIDDELAAEWSAVRAWIGLELPMTGAAGTVDAVDASSIRRWCEALEFDSDLHHSGEVARRHGFGDAIAPYSSITSYALPALWEPGHDSVFGKAGVDAQPLRSPVAAIELPGAPAVTGFFATEIENNYIRPLEIGDRVTKGARRLIDCVPKQTRVGRGAFITIETTLTDQHGALVAVNRSTYFYYRPHRQFAEADNAQ